MFVKIKSNLEELSSFSKEMETFVNSKKNRTIEVQPVQIQGITYYKCNDLDYWYFTDAMIESNSSPFSDSLSEFYFLSSLLFLNNEISKCHDYDGYSEEHQTNYYISQNGFNPIEKLNHSISLFKKYYNPLLSNIALNLFNNKPADISLSYYSDLGLELESSFSFSENKTLIVKIYFILLNFKEKDLL